MPLATTAACDLSSLLALSEFPEKQPFHEISSGDLFLFLPELLFYPHSVKSVYEHTSDGKTKFHQLAAPGEAGKPFAIKVRGAVGSSRVG